MRWAMEWNGGDTLGKKWRFETKPVFGGEKAGNQRN